MIRTLMFIFCVLGMLSCKEEVKKEQKDFFTINIKDKKEIKASDIYKDIKYIPLETIKESIIPSISKVVINNDKIVVMHIASDLQRTFYVFDINGKFLNKIIKPTEGPEKLLGVLDFKVYENTLEVLDKIQGKIFTLNINNGDLLKTTDVLTGLQFFEKIGDDYILSSQYGPIDSINQEIFVLSKNSIAPLDFTTPDYLRNLPLELSPFSPVSFEQKLLYCQFYSNDIYSVGVDGVEVSYTVDFGNIMPTKQQLNNVKSDPMKRFQLLNNPEYTPGIRLAGESEQKLLLVFSHGRVNYFSSYDKKEKISKLVYANRKNGNDINFGMLPTLPRGMTENKELIFIVQPYDLKDFVINKKNQLSDTEYNNRYTPENHFFKMENQLKNEDNPVIIFASLKDDFF